MAAGKAKWGILVIDVNLREKTQESKVLIIGGGMGGTILATIWRSSSAC